MAFIDKADYGSSIENEYLDEITQVSDPMLDIIEAWAIGFASGYLNTRFDCVNIFNKTAGARDAVIVQLIVDLSIWRAHNRLSPNLMPENRQKVYDGCINWLEQVQMGNIEPPGLPKPDDNSKLQIRSGNRQPPRDYDY